MRLQKAKQPITAVILSGGQSTRMGGHEKGLIPFVGKPMISHIVRTLLNLQSSLQAVLINTNNPSGYEQFGLKIVTDNLPGNLGPLAGIEAGLSSIEQGYLLVLPCDAPLVTIEPICRLIKAITESDINCAVIFDGERVQATFAIFHVSQRDSLKAYLKRGGRRLITWYQEQGAIEVDCTDLRDIFTNVNTMLELSNAEKLYCDKHIR